MLRSVRGYDYALALPSLVLKYGESRVSPSFAEDAITKPARSILLE